MPHPTDAPRTARGVTGLALSVVTVAATLAASPSHADHEPLPAERRAVSYVVRAGDTASSLAVRFHAWTAEIISHNHLGHDGGLRVSQRIVIPVVRTSGDTEGDKGNKGGRGGKGGKGASMWQHPDREREKVRRVVAGAARHHGVDPQLALAVSWQESGWQMGVVSSANAIGAMQVLPSTGRWMEQYAGRSLDLRTLGGNAIAGVLLLRVLSRLTHRRTHKIGAYYQGLGAVQRHGLYEETEVYVANVEAIKHRLEVGRPPS